MSTNKNIIELEHEIELLKKEMAMLKPRIDADVSVIVTVTDNESALKDCLDVLLIQNLVAMEVICIYSGSCEKIVNLLHQYSSFDSRVIVYHITDKSMNSVFQYGVQFSRADYITFLSVNCWYTNENVLQKLYETAKANDADACGGSSYHFGFKLDRENLFKGHYKYKDLNDDEILSCYLFKKSAIAQKVNDLPELIYFYSRPFTTMLLNELDGLYKISEPVCVRRAIKNEEIGDLYLCAELNDGISEHTLRAVSDYLNSAECGLIYAAKNGLHKEYARIYRNLLSKDQLVLVGEFYRAENPQIVKSVKKINDIMDTDILDKEDFYAYDDMYHISLFEALREKSVNENMNF